MFNPFNEIKSIFRVPEAYSVIQRELEIARLALLQHESAAEYHTAMIEVQRTRIARLRRHSESIKEADK